MVHITMANGSRTRLMAWVDSFIMTGIFMKGNGKMTRQKGKENSFIIKD